MLEAILQHISGQCHRELALLRLVSRLWKSTIEPFLVAHLHTGGPMGIESECIEACHLFSVMDWLKRDPSLAGHIYTLSINDDPALCQEDYQHLLVTTLAGAYRLLDLNTHWAALLKLSLPMLNLPNFNSLSTLRLRFYAGDAGFGASTALLEIVQHVPNLRTLSLSVHQTCMTGAVIDVCRRLFGHIHRKSINLELDLIGFYFGDTRAGRDDLMSTSIFCNNLAEVLPMVEELSLKLGNGPLRDFEPLFVESVKRLALRAWDSTICSFLMKVATSPTFLPNLEYLPEIVALNGHRAPEEDALITGDLVHAAIDGLRQRKSPNLRTQAGRLAQHITYEANLL